MTRTLTPKELAEIGLWLDLTDSPVVNTAVARRLLATCRDLQAREKAAFAMLATSLHPDPKDA